MYLSLKRSSWLVLLIVLFVLRSVAPAAPPSPSTNASASPRGRIIVLGDSITAGHGLPDLQQAYPALLQAKVDTAGLPYEVVNNGVSGDTTTGGLRRIDWALSRGAAVLIIALGGNDGLRGIEPQQTVANLEGIIDRARAKVPEIRILVAGMNMPASMGAEFAQQFQAVFPKVANERKVALLPFLLEGVGGVANLNQADNIHPTAEGQQKVAENVWAKLQPLLGEH